MRTKNDTNRGERSTTHLSETVRRQIESEIRQNQWEPGDRLPTVDEWCERLSVGRRTVLKAIGQLRDRGVLESHVGRGAFLLSMPKESEAPARRHRTLAVLDGITDAGLHAELSESWTARILSGIRDEASRNDYDLLLINYNPAGQPASAVEDRLRRVQMSVDGLISFPFARVEEMFDILDRVGLPTVTINRLGADQTDNYVDADYFGGSRVVGQMAAELEARDVWFLSTQVAGVFSKEQRYAGLIDGIRVAGGDAKVHVLLAETPSEDDGRQLVAERLAKSGHPDLIYCSGDYLASGAVHALLEAGVQVGEACSVIGSSGFSFTWLTRPTISTVDIPMTEMGRTVFRMIMDMIDRGLRRVPGQSLPTTLRLRQSSHPSLLESGWLDRAVPVNAGREI